MRLARLAPPVVLAYHGVGEADEGADPVQLVLDPALFDDQVALLRRAGYEFATASDLAASASDSPRRGTAVLTFDDGWLDAVHTVLPRLRARGIPATFFVCPGWFGGQHPDVAGPAGRLVDRHDVAALAAAGMDIGSHSLLHRDLRALPAADLADDLAESKALVEDATGRRCATLAYPYGLSDPAVEAAAQTAGYDLSFSWTPGPWSAQAAPRLPAPPRHGARRLALKLLGVRRGIAS